MDDLVARGIVRREAGERKDDVATRAALDLGIGQVGWRHEDVDPCATASMPQLAYRFQRRLERGLAIDHEVARMRVGALKGGCVQQRCRQEDTHR